MIHAIRSFCRGGLIGLLCSGMLVMSLPSHAQVIGTEAMLAAEARQNDLAAVEAFMGRDAVRAEMERFGVDAEAAALRVASLSDTELRQLAGQIEQQPAGAGAIEVIGVVFLVLLILELVGVINIFNRI
ncbi:MAG TPA: PA2779 family protein [Solimonas sp.]